MYTFKLDHKWPFSGDLFDGDEPIARLDMAFLSSSDRTLEDALSRPENKEHLERIQRLVDCANRGAQAR